MKKGLRGRYYASDDKIKPATLKGFKEQQLVEFYEEGRHSIT